MRCRNGQLCKVSDNDSMPYCVAGLLEIDVRTRDVEIGFKNSFFSLKTSEVLTSKVQILVFKKNP